MKITDLFGNELSVDDEVVFTYYKNDSELHKGRIEKFTNRTIVIDIGYTAYLKRIVPINRSDYQLIKIIQ